jgi:hypothetical protein
MPVDPDAQALLDMMAATGTPALNTLRVGAHPLTPTICRLFAECGLNSERIRKACAGGDILWLIS